jgi:hypothetical protein
VTERLSPALAATTLPLEIRSKGARFALDTSGTGQKVRKVATQPLAGGLPYNQCCWQSATRW